MSKIDTMNSKSNLSCIGDKLFTELTPETAEVVQGGAVVLDGNVNFDFRLTSSEFRNAIGTKIAVKLDTHAEGAINANNNFFTVTLQRKNIRRFRPDTWTDVGSKAFRINGGGNHTWGNLGNNTYRLQFTDVKDFKRIVGSVTVWD